jgi:hypothetical protein
MLRVVHHQPSQTASPTFTPAPVMDKSTIEGLDLLK